MANIFSPNEVVRITSQLYDIYNPNDFETFRSLVERELPFLYARQTQDELRNAYNTITNPPIPPPPPPPTLNPLIYGPDTIAKTATQKYLSRPPSQTLVKSITKDLPPPSENSCIVCGDSLDEGPTHTGPCGHTIHVKDHEQLISPYNARDGGDPLVAKYGQKVCPICRYNERKSRQQFPSDDDYDKYLEQRGYGKPRGFGGVSIESERRNQLSYSTKRALQLGSRRKLKAQTEKDLYF
jgi:hypothetical protein